MIPFPNTDWRTSNPAKRCHAREETCSRIPINQACRRCNDNDRNKPANVGCRSKPYPTTAPGFVYGLLIDITGDKPTYGFNPDLRATRRPCCIRLAYLHRICDHKPHSLGRAAIADYAVKTCLIVEGMPSQDKFLGIVVKGRHHRAFQHIPYARDRMPMPTTVRTCGIRDEKQACFQPGRPATVDACNSSRVISELIQSSSYCSPFCRAWLVECPPAHQYLVHGNAKIGVG